MTASQPDLEDILREIKLLRGRMDKLENIIEKRLVGKAKPDKYEKRAIADFEKKRRAGKLAFVPLSKLRE